MASFSIDPNNRIIILDQVAPVSGFVEYAVREDFYSEMKVYWKDQSGVQGLIFPWKPVGGFAYGGGRFQGTDYFLRNDLGWRIRPYEADHEVQIIGNLRPYNTAFPTFIPTVGGYTVYAPQERSGVFQVVELGGSYPSASEIATAVRAELAIELQAVLDVAKMNLNKVTRVGKVITIYNNDHVTPWRIYDLEAGTRTQL